MSAPGRKGAHSGNVHAPGRPVRQAGQLSAPAASQQHVRAHARGVLHSHPLRWRVCMATLRLLEPLFACGDSWHGEGMRAACSRSPRACPRPARLASLVENRGNHAVRAVCSRNSQRNTACDPSRRNHQCGSTRQLARCGRAARAADLTRCEAHHRGKVAATGASSRGLHRLGRTDALPATRQASKALPRPSAEHARISMRARRVPCAAGAFGPAVASYPALNITCEPS